MMEEDAFDDNGWSRFFAPDAQRKVDPPKAECDLELERLANRTEDEGSLIEEECEAECILRTEDDGKKIDFRMRQFEEQRKIGDLEGYGASVVVERCVMEEEMPHFQGSFLDTGFTQSGPEIHYCELTPLDIGDAKHAVSATQWPPLDTSSLKKIDQDEPRHKDRATTDGAKAATDSTLFECLPVKEDINKNITEEAEETVGDQAKASFDGPPFGSLSLERTDKDKTITKAITTVDDQAKAANESSVFESLSLKEEDKDKNNIKKAGNAAHSQMKAATNSSHVGFLIFKKAGLFIFRNVLQSLHESFLSTWFEKKHKAKNKIRSWYGSLLFNWLEMEDEDKHNTRDALKAVSNRPKATTEFCHVRTGSSSKLDDSRSSEKRQTVESTTAQPEFLSKNVKPLNSWFPLFLSMLISVLFQAAGGTLVVAPNDMIGMKREEIRLRCSTQFQKAVYWERILVGSKEQQTIYFGINGMVNIDGSNGRIKIDSDPATGQYDLVIKDLQPMDAATYICIGDNGIGEEKRAQLIVLDYFSCHLPMPSNGFMGENTVNLAVENIQASCSLQYYGHVTPRIEWRLNNIQINASHANNGTTVKSMVTLRGTKELNGANLSSLPTVSAAHDSEKDTIIAWWTSAQLKVNYIHLELGKVAECQGDSAMVPVCVPSCEYQQVMTPGDELCHCVAVYNMDGVNYDVIFNKHPCQGSDFTSDKSMIIIVVCVIGATVFGVLVGVIIVLIIKIKRSKSSKERRGVGANKLLS